MLDQPRRSLRRLLGRSSGPPGAPATEDPANSGASGDDGASRTIVRARNVAAGRRHQRATPPNVLGAGPLVAAPGYRLAVVVIVRNEEDYLEEWLSYHHALGVDHFFVYDNGSDDGTAALLERWVNHGLVTVVAWPLPGGQIDAYNHALRFFGPSVDWLAYFDVDEFVVPLVDDDIPTFLARFPDAADVRVPRREFGFSGHRTRPMGLVIEAYTGIADVFGRDPEKGARVKTIVQPRGVSAVGVHTATVADVPAARADEPTDRPLPTRTIRGPVEGLAQLNHYYTRSFEEFEAKRFRGSATGRIARPAIPLDLPTLETDTSAHRFIGRTQAMIERMRTLERRPYRYGSQSSLSQFPRSNDLGLFAEFTFANIVAGLAEPSREPQMRLANLHTGIGFVGDLGAAGHSGAPGEVSGSVHLPQLLEHIRGRMALTFEAARASNAGEATARGAGDERGWLVAVPETGACLVLPIAGDGMRRCYAVGFELTADEPVTIELALVHDDGPPKEPVILRLERAATWGGIVEVDDAPRLSSSATVTLRSEAPEVVVADLFLLSYG